MTTRFLRGGLTASFLVLALATLAADGRPAYSSAAWRAKRSQQLYDQIKAAIPPTARAASTVDGRRLVDAASAVVGPPRPFQMNVVYSDSVSQLPGDQKDHIMKDVMPRVQATIQRFLRVRHPLRSNLVLPPVCKVPGQVPCTEYDATCAIQTLPLDYFAAPAGSGAGVDADFVLVVGASPDTNIDCAVEQLGWGLTCSYDAATNRPIAGELYFCQVNVFDVAGDVESALHEVIHALGFTSDTWTQGRMVNASGIPGSLPAAQVAVAGAAPPFYITSPLVKQYAQDFFGCDTLPGAELENDGGAGTMGQHWESRIYLGELMDASAQSQTFSGTKRITNLTLGFLSDTGWYDVDMSKAMYVSWGRGGGCDLSMGSYATAWASTNTVNQRYLCDAMGQLNNIVCNYDYTAQGFCHTDPLLWDGFYRVTEDPSSPQPCLTGPGVLSFPLAQHGPGSRCIPFDTGAACVLMGCAAGGVVVTVEGNTQTCPAGGGVTYAGQGTLGPCPATSVICGDTCTNDCNGQGDCLNGVCRCHTGFVGVDCSTPICLSDANCPAGQLCGASGECAAPPPNLAVGLNCKTAAGTVAALSVVDPATLTAVGVISGDGILPMECSSDCVAVTECRWAIVDGKQCVLQSGGTSNWMEPSFEMNNIYTGDSVPSNVDGVEWYNVLSGIPPQDCVAACVRSPSCKYVEIKWAGCRLYGSGTDSAASVAALTGNGTWFDVSACTAPAPASPVPSGTPAPGSTPGSSPGSPSGSGSQGANQREGSSPTPSGPVSGATALAARSAAAAAAVAVAFVLL